MSQELEVARGLLFKRSSLKNLKKNYSEQRGYIVSWPHATESRFRKEMTDMFYSAFPKVEWKNYKTEIAKRIMSWDVNLPTYDADINKLLDDTYRLIAILFSSGGKDNIKSKLSIYYDDIVRRVISLLEKDVSRSLSYDFIYTDKSYLLNKNAWIDEKVIELRAIYDSTYAALAALLTTGIQSGWSNRDFFEGIHSIVRKTAVQRQPLFLHNFVGMLVSTTAKDFMLNIGMKEYMWITMRDEKVRGNPAGKYPDAVPSHWIIDSKICSWKDASIFSDDGRIFRNRTLMMPKVHPGMEINCRCAAAPFWGNLNREADIRKEEV